MPDKAKELTGKLLLFRAGTMLALPLASVDEVLPFVQLTCPPSAPGSVVGIANVSGVAVTVINLSTLLDLDTPAPDSRWHMIKLKRPDPPLALLVERAMSAVDARALDLAPISGDVTFNGMIQGELIRNGDPVAHLLDAEKVLTAEEAQRLENFARLAQDRLDGLEVA
ncbi:MAG: chemotaxis protein CheW [Alphaproteobacteria bacterium]|uniref:chemotaxis protein CheW n=1 Tax=Nisaea sp. TaxID=2024842 RepID=UPI0032661C2D